MVEAGLSVRESGDGRSAFEFRDDETMLRQMTAAGGVERVTRAVGEQAERRTLLEAMEAFRTADGGYRLENAWHVAVASP